MFSYLLIPISPLFWQKLADSKPCNTSGQKKVLRLFGLIFSLDPTYTPPIMSTPQLDLFAGRALDFPVDTRRFYSMLDRDTPYSQWITKTIARMDLSEGTDYLKVTYPAIGRGRPMSVYHVTKPTFLRIMQDVVKTES